MKKIKQSHRHQVMRHRGLSHVPTDRPESLVIETRQDADKFIVVIETPPTAAHFVQVTTLFNDAELEQAKRLRPDLVFRLPEHMVIEHALQEEPVGESLTGLTIPAEDHERWMKDLLK